VAPGWPAAQGVDRVIGVIGDAIGSSASDFEADTMRQVRFKRDGEPTGIRAVGTGIEGSLEKA
jgi:hypothetical protein